MQDHPPLDSERLVLVPLTAHHAEALHSVFSDAAAMRFWPVPPHDTVTDTEAMIARLAAGRERAWALLPRGEADAVGLVYFLGDGQSGTIGLGYILDPARWGRGLMSEAVRTVLGFAFDRLGLDRVELWIDAGNAASLALAARLGFTRRGAFRQRYPHRDDAFETIVLGLSVDAWRPGTPRRRRPPIVAYGAMAELAVADVAASAAFYRDRLGFDIAFIIGEPPDFAIVWLGDWSFAGARIGLRRADTPPSPDTVTLSIDVGPGVDALYEAYRDKGVAIAAAPLTRPWGRREFAVKDVDGYTLRFGTAV